MDDDLKDIKKTMRWVGGYAFLTLGTLLFGAYTVPNGPAPWWNILLVVAASILIVLPYVLYFYFFLYLEVTKYKRLTRVSNQELEDDRDVWRGGLE